MTGESGESEARAPAGWGRPTLFAVAAATAAEIFLQLLFLLLRAPLFGDEGNYLLNALAIARGDLAKVTAYNSPLYSALCAVPVALGIDPEIGCRLVNVLAVVALVPVTAWMAGAAFAPLAGALAAWMVVTCPLVAWMGNSALSEPTATLLAALALALAMPTGPDARPAGARRLIAAGAAGALAVFGRSETAYVVLLAAACAFWGARERRSRALAAVLVGGAVVAALGLGAIQAAGWTRDYFSKGTIAVSLAGRGLYEDPVTADRVVYGLTPGGERVVDEPGRSMSPAMLIPTARRALRQWPQIVQNLVNECASPLPLLLAPIALLALRWPRRARAVPWALGLAAALPVAISSCVEPIPRYLLPAIPFLMALAAGGLALGVISRPPGAVAAGVPPDAPAVSPRGVALWFALLVLVPLPWAVGRTLNGIAGAPRVYRETGLWMREHLERGRMLARPGTYISYYAGVPEYTWMPAASAEATLAHARRKGIRYLVLDGRLSLASRPGFAALLEGASNPATKLGLRGLYTNGEPGVDRIIVYQIFPGEVPDSIAP